VSQYLATLPNDAVMRLGGMTAAVWDAAAILAGGTDSDQAGTPTLPDDVFAAVVRSVISTGADSRGPAWILAALHCFSTRPRAATATISQRN
jgi:hypothetical protein